MKVGSDRPIKRVAAVEQVQNVIETCRLLSGQPSPYFKIFAIGFNKTGTTSLYTLFRQLGFTAMDGPHWRKQEQWHVHYQFQAFSDGPPEDFRVLDKTFPRSKFILNVRDLQEWLDSRIEHVRLRMRDPRYKARMSKGKLPDLDIICEWIRNRQKHHLAVLSYFRHRPDDLLVLNFIADPDASRKVAAFLQCAPPDAAKPYTRSTAATRSHGQLCNDALLRSAFNQLSIPDAERHYDVLLPCLLAEEQRANFLCDTRLGPPPP